MSTMHYEQSIFQGTVLAGDPPQQSVVFRAPEGLLPEKIGLWISLSLGDPSDIVDVVAEWAGDDGVYLPTFADSSQTVTTSCILTLCNPGGATSLQLTLSSTGLGTDTLGIVAKTNVEE